jgi:3-oxoacyl-[acyl-carrier protein] reductase
MAEEQTTQELAGCVAVVTGGGRNIGRAIALELARAGAAVVVNVRQSIAQADAVVDEIVASGGRATTAVADVAEPQGCAGIIATAVERFGRLDILVNNASIRRETAFADLDYREWREILGITLDGAYLCTHAALSHLTRSGRGAVVNIGGLSAHTGAAGRAHVIAAKAGLSGLTRALAHDLAPYDITVNCVAPGLIDTVRGTASTQGPQPAHHAAHAPVLGRRGKPQEIAALVRFLSGPGARYVTGQTIHANGGVYMT